MSLPLYNYIKYRDNQQRSLTTTKGKSMSDDTESPKFEMGWSGNVPVSQLHHSQFSLDVYGDIDNDIKRLVDSIRETGYLQTFIINNRGQVLAGNRRLRAVRILEYPKEVPCRVFNSEDEDAQQAFILIDNITRHQTKSALAKQASLLKQKLSNEAQKRKMQGIMATDAGRTTKKLSDELKLPIREAQALAFIGQQLEKLEKEEPEKAVEIKEALDAEGATAQKVKKKFFPSPKKDPVGSEPPESQESTTDSVIFKKQFLYRTRAIFDSALGIVAKNSQQTEDTRRLSDRLSLIISTMDLVIEQVLGEEIDNG
jgi:ParB-like chromosome segregation protein Spo0J